MPEDTVIAVNETQRLAFNARPTSGTFTLAFEDDPDTTTATISANSFLGVSNQDIQDALEDLPTSIEGFPTVGKGNVACTKYDDLTYVVTFWGGLAGVDMPQLVAETAKLRPGIKTLTVTTLRDGQEGSGDDGNVQAAINAVYEALLTLNHGGPYNYPSGVNAVDKAIRLLSPYQTVEAAVT